MRTPPGKRGTGGQPGRSIAAKRRGEAVSPPGLDPPELPGLELLELELPELPELELPEPPELPELQLPELQLPELPELPGLMAGLIRAELLELAAGLATHPACNIAEAVAELLTVYTPINHRPRGRRGAGGKK